MDYLNNLQECPCNEYSEHGVCYPEAMCFGKLEKDLKIEKGTWYVCTRKFRYGSCMFYKGAMYLCLEDGTLIDTTGHTMVFNQRFIDDGYSVCEHFRPATQSEVGLTGQESSEPIESGKKFKEGDYIHHNHVHAIYRVVSVSKGSCYCQNMCTGGYIEIFDAEKNFHLWSIRDAQKGDIIVDFRTFTVGIFEDANDKNWHSMCYCGLNPDSEQVFEDGGSHFVKNSAPGDNVNKALLIRKFNDAGYVWDEDAKEMMNKHRKEFNDAVSDLIRRVSVGKHRPVNVEADGLLQLAKNVLHE